MSLMRPVTARPNRNRPGTLLSGRISQSFQGTFSGGTGWKKRGKNGIWRGKRWWFKGSNKVAPNLHLAIDYAAPEGTPIHAPHAGKIIAQGVDSYDGARYLYLEVKVGRVYKVVLAFWHIKAGSFRLNVGDTVRRGQVIASVGATGHVTGPHLHFEVWRVLRGTLIRYMYRLATRFDPQPFVEGRHLTEIV